MRQLFIFGLGYTAGRFVETHAADFGVVATVTTRKKASALTRPGCEVMVFSPDERDARLEDALAQTELLLVSIGPDEGGDPALNVFGDALSRARNLRAIVYLSTIGVYGDYAGAWIDESAQCRPTNARGDWRLRAEADWRTIGAAIGAPVHVLRLGGIYGPGQNALVNLQRGAARRIVKPGQVFNRIHVDDIGAAIDACFAQPGAGGVWNCCDDEPAPAEDVVTYAAELMGVEPPPLLDFDTANLSPMARSFYSECKRCSNRAMREKLGVTLNFPTYREGIRALADTGDGK